VNQAPTLLLSSGLAAILVAVLNALFQRRKISADAAHAISGATVGMLDPLRRELDRVHADLEATEAEVDHLREEIRKLTLELRRERRARMVAEERLRDLDTPHPD
jgi:predicted  nucleic acid-binding Zn-ribbon protein